MESYRVVQVRESNAMAASGWAIERTDESGLRLIVSPFYRVRSEAEAEADILANAAKRRRMG